MLRDIPCSSQLARYWRRSSVSGAAKDCYRNACMLRLLTLGLLLLAQAQGEPGGGGLIRGVLTDATGAVLPGGFIRVFQTPSNALITRLRVEPDGGFQTGQLQPGSYIVVAWVQGFSARRSSVVILEGQTTDMGKIQLEVGSCDAPGVMCDDFGIGPPDRIRSQGYLELKMDCGVNLRESKVYCPDASGRPKRPGLRRACYERRRRRLSYRG